MKTQKEWRPRIKETQACLQRRNKFLVIVCQTQDEADIVERYIIKGLKKSRNISKFRDIPFQRPKKTGKYQETNPSF